jgi:hypothetical protein
VRLTAPFEAITELTFWVIGALHSVLFNPVLSHQDLKSSLLEMLIGG